MHIEDLLGLVLVRVGSRFWAVFFAPAGHQMVSRPYLFLWCLCAGNVLLVEMMEFWKPGNVTASLSVCQPFLPVVFFFFCIQSLRKICYYPKEWVLLFLLQTEAGYLKPRNPTSASNMTLARVPKVNNGGVWICSQNARISNFINFGRESVDFA